MVLCKKFFEYLVNLFELNELFFQKVESSLEVQRTKETFSDNPGHNILQLYSVLVQIGFAKSKTKLVCISFGIDHKNVSIFIQIC